MKNIWHNHSLHKCTIPVSYRKYFQNRIKNTLFYAQCTDSRQDTSQYEPRVQFDVGFLPQYHGTLIMIITCIIGSIGNHNKRKMFFFLLPFDFSNFNTSNDTF